MKALLALLLASPAMAQDLTPALCNGALKAVEAGIGLAITADVSVDAGACVYRQAVLVADTTYGPDWHAERVSLSGSAVAAVAGAGVLPETLEVDVTGLRAVVRTGMAQYDYVYGVQSQRSSIDLTLSARWSAADNVLDLTALQVDFPGANAVSFSFALAGLDLSSLAAFRASGQAALLTRADLRVQTHGLFETYVMLPLAPMLLPGEGDFPALEADLKARAVDLIGTLPATSVDAASQAALAALVQALPAPDGVLELALRSDPGFGSSKLEAYFLTVDAEPVADLATLLAGTTLTATWTEEPAE